MAKKAKPGLGKGLGALIPSVEFDKDKGYSIAKDTKEELGLLELLELERIQTNPFQPRKEFDETALTELSESIKKHGVIQPITVRKSESGYELISGERRVRASLKAGLSAIPAYVLDVDSDSAMLEIAIIENVQREDLNPMEIAYGYQRLIEECGYTQEQVSDRVSKERSTVTNFLRLLRLPEKLQESLRSRQISMGHARALLALQTHSEMIKAHDVVKLNKLSVRATEQYVSKLKNKNGQTNNNKRKKLPETNPVLESAASNLRNAFGTQVRITPKSKESGIIEIEFYSGDDFERLMDLFDKIKE